MRALFKWIIRLGGLVASVVFILTAVVFFTGQRLVARYVPTLEAAIHDSTGVRVHLPNIRVLLLPRLRIISESATIESRDQVGGISAELAIPTFHLEFSWLPLLRGEMVVHKVVLKAPRIDLHRQTNDYPVNESPEPATSAPPLEVNLSPLVPATPHLVFRTARFPHIVIRDGALRFFNSSGSPVFAISDIHLGGELSIHGPASFSAPGCELKGLVTHVGDANLPTPIAFELETSLESNVGVVSAFPVQAFLHQLSSPGPTKLLISANHAMQFDLKAQRINAADLSVQLGQSAMKFVATGNSASAEGNLSVELANLDTENISHFLSPLFPSRTLPNSLVDGHFSLTRGLDGTIRASGKTTIRRLTMPGVSLDEANLTDISIIAAQDGAMHVHSNVQLRRPGVTTAEREHYATSKVDGAVRLSRSSGGRWRAEGGLAVEGFSYSDSTLTLRDVDAKLTTILADFGGAGGSKISATLIGSRATLTDPTVTISGVQQVRAPLRVEIPSFGGYTVSGPITVENASVTTAGFALQQARGVVNMRLSPESKHFTSDKVGVSLGEERIESAADFEILGDSYMLHALRAEGFGGSVTGSVSYGRQHHDDVQTYIEVRNVSLTRALPALLPQKTELPKGMIAELLVEGRSMKGDVISSFDGAGKVLIRDGIVSRIGVDAALARSLQAVPIVGSQFQFAELSQKEATGSDSLALRLQQSRELSATFKVSQRKIASDDLMITGRSGTVKLNGSYDIAAGFSADGQVVFLEKTLAGLAGPIHPLGKMIGSIGRIEIPIQLTGPIENPKVRSLPSRILSVTGPTRMLSDVVDGTVGALGKLVRPRQTP